jgi:protein O-GlcNAc transferase
MKCPRCCYEVRESARFCERCGSILRSDDPAYELAYAYRLEITGELEEAARHYERILSDSELGADLPAVHKHLGNLHLRLGHLRRAKAHLSQACELEPGNAAFWHDLGVVTYHMADFDASIDALREALHRDPDQQLAWFWLGNALYHKGDKAGAARAFRSLIERYPNFTIAHFHLGVIYARQGKRRDAEEEFRRVLLKNPEDVAARFYVSQADPAHSS